MNLAIGKAVQLGIWGAKVNGELLVPSCNNPTVATVTAKGTATLDGTIRNITVTGLKEGRVMLEAKLPSSGAVWAFTQLVVGTVAQGSRVGLQAVQVAKQELQMGVFEDEGNTNTGSRINTYEGLFGLNRQPWCAMFVYWCFNAASSTLDVPNPMPKIASAQALLTWARQHSKLVDEPAAGDILIVKPGSHVGLVTGPTTAARKVPSIEGNTWAGGTEEDHVDGVYAKSRFADRAFYVRV